MEWLLKELTFPFILSPPLGLLPELERNLDAFLSNNLSDDICSLSPSPAAIARKQMNPLLDEQVVHTLIVISTLNRA